MQFTASAELRDKLERLRALMRAQVPDGDLAAVIEEPSPRNSNGSRPGVFAKTRTPRKGLAETDLSSSSRHIPAPVRRAVYDRDGGRCRYVDDTGRRCPERSRLEYHHLYPFGRGGDHSPQNIHLVCGAHNEIGRAHV